jgi:hypothetical protein
MSVLGTIRSGLVTPVERRLFCEYGAIFATEAAPPPTVIFRNAEEVERFQSTLAVRSAAIGDYEFTLQAPAMERLLFAVRDAEDMGLSLNPRSADSGARSYADTVALWLRNVSQGLQHWVGASRLAQADADEIQRMAPNEQVEPILNLEDNEGLWFGTFLNRSILYSVAAPGASQHLSLLAFDVREYQDDAVKGVLNRHGWFRTVPNDLPHFTFLGKEEKDLMGIGLKEVYRKYDEEEYSFWVPDV